MAAMAAVGIDDNLAAGEPRIAHWSTNYESTCRIDMVLDARWIVQPFRHGWSNNVLHQILLDLFIGHVWAVLCRNDNGIDAERFAVFVFNRHLRLAVRTNPLQELFLAYFRETFGQPVSQYDRHGHKFSGFVGGVPEHKTL